MVSATSLTLAVVHFLVWVRVRASREHLLFSVAAIAATAMALLELRLIHTPTPAAYGEVLRWMHLPTATIVIAIVWFIRFYLRSGRSWLAWSITAMRVALLCANFLTQPNATFREITGIRVVSFLGESLSVPEGTQSPWRILAQLSVLLLLAYVADASLKARRQMGSRRPLFLCGVVCYAVLQAAVFSTLMARGVVPAPFVSVSFALIVLAMALELSIEVVHARALSTDLRRSQEQLMHVQRVSAMEQLSSSLMHEINQPLGAILRNAEAGELFLRKDPPDLDELREILVDIRRDEQRAVEVIQRLRSLLKRRELQRETLAIDDVVKEVVAMIGGEVKSQHASLSMDIPGGLPPVLADRVHLQQVILNLLLNGLEAMNGTRERHRRIVVRVSQPDDDIIEVSVADVGSGIAEDHLTSIFQPFYTTKPTGTGIGLSICKTIIELHGGRIWAENNAGGGATVRFTLPAAEKKQAT